MPEVGPDVAGRRVLEGLTIAHVGHFDPAYARNRIMAKALRRAGARVVEVTDLRRFARRTPGLVTRTAAARPDLVLVAFPGQADVAAARLAARGAPVVLDAFSSILETAEDRDQSSWLRSRWYAAEDRVACRLADVVLLDTDAHIGYFARRFGVAPAKMRRVPVGADDEVMFPRPEPPREGCDQRFRVVFCGTYIPLQGVDTIVRAAAVLERAGEEVDFLLVGNGQTYDSVRSLAARLDVGSVRFAPRVPYEGLPAVIAGADVYLGIFGATDKAARVIPNKVFDGLAMARPVVTADTPAAREVLVHGRHAWLCPPADPEALAAGIVALRADDRARVAMAADGHALFRQELSIDALSARVAGIVRQLVP